MTDSTTIDKKTIISDALEIDPQEYFLTLESNLSELIQKMINEKPYAHIILAERKGPALFDQFIPRLFERYISIRVFRFDKGHPIIRVISVSKDRNFLANIKIIIKKFFISTKIFWEPGIFLTDTINKGNEFRSAYFTAKSDGIQITDVYGYIAKKDGLKALKKEFPKINFNFIEEIDAPKDDDPTIDPWNEIHWKSHLKLMSYFQSMMTPLDIDHPIFTYKFISGLDEQSFKSIVDDTFSKIIGNANFFQWDENLTPFPGLFGYSVELFKPELLREYSPILTSDKISVNRVTIRYKINYLQCKLVVTIVPEICTRGELNPTSDVCKNFKLKNCRGKMDKSIKNSICPQCIDNNFLFSINELFNEHFINHEISKRYKLTKISETSINNFVDRLK